MPIKELQPIPTRLEDWEPTAERLRLLFRRLLYQPLLDLLPLPKSKKTLENALDDVISAINSGRIAFHRGVFSGRLNAGISRELKRLGAEWRKGAWHIPLSDLPIEVKSAIALSERRFDELLSRIQHRLETIVPEDIAEAFNCEDLFIKNIWRVEKDFQKSVRNITIAPKLTAEEAATLSKEYSKSLQLPIKEWCQKEIETLRGEVELHAMRGRRLEDLAQMIRVRHGVGESKAKFLARQETNLLTASLREIRYKSAGIQEYKWRCVVGTPEHPTRHRHKELDRMSREEGKTFRWDDPPITTEPGQPIRRNNPKCDYNCRCQAVPIVRF